ncbi:hypothetical protein ACFDTO_04000 [Microbacteriaceae bacterium 4G12]
MAATELTPALALGAKEVSRAPVAVSNAAMRLRDWPLTVVNSPTA